jgi:hypothetical protein
MEFTAAHRPGRVGVGKHRGGDSDAATRRPARAEANHITPTFSALAGSLRKCAHERENPRSIHEDARDAARQSRSRSLSVRSCQAHQF